MLKENMNNLIICPVGNPLTFHKNFKNEDHWRYVNNDRNYETLVFQYSNYVPEDNTYNILIQQKGFKWSLSKEWLPKIDYFKYDYIGFMDDDLVTDYISINKSLEMAKENNFKIFQLSTTGDSDEFFKILVNKDDVKYSKTNFVETMGMFLHTSLIPTVLEFWNEYDIYCGWGFDKVLCDITKEDAAVIHKYQMYHPKKNSSYDKTSAFREMDKVLYEITPKFMNDKYNQGWKYVERQYEKEIVMELI